MDSSMVQSLLSTVLQEPPSPRVEMAEEEYSSVVSSHEETESDDSSWTSSIPSPSMSHNSSDDEDYHGVEPYPEAEGSSESADKSSAMMIIDWVTLNGKLYTQR